MSRRLYEILAASILLVYTTSGYASAGFSALDRCRVHVGAHERPGVLLIADGYGSDQGSGNQQGEGNNQGGQNNQVAGNHEGGGNDQEVGDDRGDQDDDDQDGGDDHGDGNDNGNGNDKHKHPYSGCQ